MDKGLNHHRAHPRRDSQHDRRQGTPSNERPTPAKAITIARTGRFPKPANTGLQPADSKP